MIIPMPSLLEKVDVVYTGHLIINAPACDKRSKNFRVEFNKDVTVTVMRLG